MLNNALAIYICIKIIQFTRKPHFNNSFVHKLPGVYRGGEGDAYVATVPYYAKA